MNKFRYISVVAAFAMAVSGSISCSNENKDAGDISIGFGQDTYKFKEGAGLSKIQINVAGDGNSYPVTFDVEAKLVSEEGADVNDVIHFTQSKGLKVKGKDIAPVYLEFTVKDNDVINETREIELSITNVKGAKVALEKATLEIRAMTTILMTSSWETGLRLLLIMAETRFHSLSISAAVLPSLTLQATKDVSSYAGDSATTSVSSLPPTRRSSLSGT